MKKIISNLNFSQLKKLEVQTLANRVLAIVEKHDPEVLKIKETFDILVEQKPQIKLLKIGHGPHPVTKKLNLLRKRRDAFTKGLINRIKTTEEAKISNKEEAVNVAKPVVIRYLQGLSRESEEIITATVIQFIDFVQENPNVTAALDTLNLTSELDDLQGVINEIEALYAHRTQNLSQRPKMDTRNIKAQLKSDIEDVFKHIEVAQIKNQDLDYIPLIDELNKEIAHYKAIIKTRASYSKKKAEEALNNDETIDDNEIVDNNEVVVEDQSEEPSKSTQSTTRMYPMNAEVDEEENSEQLDIKKTVAASAKHMRLPNNPTEA